jgi:hypothetical protein
VSSVFSETYQSDAFSPQNVFLAFSPAFLPCKPSFVHLSSPLFGSPISFFYLPRPTMNSESHSAPVMKTSFTWYHVLLLRPEAGNKPMIPADGFRHTPAVAMLNHLICFMESAVNEDQDKQCHYSPVSSFFIRGVIALREQSTVVGDARWEQSTEHSHAFSAIAIQLLHDLGALFYHWIIMGPATSVGNWGLKVYVLIWPITTMQKSVNNTTLYAEWLKDFKIYLRTH